MDEKNQLLTWILEPCDTLIVRDGRPASKGVPMKTLSFPLPSSLAGMVRTLVGQDKLGVFRPNPEETEALLGIQIKGPFLAVLEPESKGGLYFPAPLDCKWFKEAKQTGEKDGLAKRVRLIPGTLKEGESTNIPEGLQVLFPKKEIPPAKPPSGIPNFWSWEEYKEWLLTPPANIQDMDLKSFGLPPIPKEERTHVTLDPVTERPLDGHLFSCEGLRFNLPSQEGNFRLSLVFSCNDSRLKPGPAQLGGERRISRLIKGDSTFLPFPPQELCGTESNIFRLILVTPGIFKGGWIPSKIEGGEIIAAAVGRPLSISGWDFKRGGPKKTRRAAPAGSVYWVKLDPGVDAKSWVGRFWLSSIADDPQDRRDGFGLCLIGVE